ncbi:nitroreductase family protein [Paenibacillus oceani]|uniref:Putative NAD(P)H nitroreductase n=1 Tax=Paenibacillus oceani TaxID=2772510 RepID=A0A927C6E5_9BACL|nr:nitroreductase [Paenibacillus oceani]MBD2862080.1 nitroreductase [Paenibacillus oceani]
MDLYEAIKSRRSIGRVKDEAISRETIELILEAGNWAPSHHSTEPWRFYVMRGEGRNVLAKAYGDIAVETAKPGHAADEAELRAKQGAKAFRAPVVIAVAASPSKEPQVNRSEEFAAVHAAVQNMLLAAHAAGLGAIWRSGEPMYHPIMNRAFGLNEDEQLTALIYLGYPDMPTPAKSRRPFQEKTVWIDTAAR